MGKTGKKENTSQKPAGGHQRDPDHLRELCAADRAGHAAADAARGEPQRPTERGGCDVHRDERDLRDGPCRAGYMDAVHDVRAAGHPAAHSSGRSRPCDADQLFALAAKRRMGFRDLRLLGESVSASGYSQATEVLKIVIRLAFLFEAIGIVLLAFAFVPQFGLEGIWISIFTAISAFCNAGFDLFGRFGQYSSLVPFVHNYYVQAVVMFLIMAGGLGFMVWVELGEWRKKRRLSLHAKVVLAFSAILWVGGAVLIALMEWSNPKTVGGLSPDGKIMAALFQSVSTRTAGMNTIDLAACGPITKLLMSVLQFIGAAPGSTGGGVKVTTFAVLILTIRSVAQGRDDCVIAEHHIESKTVYRALTIIMLGMVAALGSAVVVYYNTSDAVSVIDAIFESCSAFGTVGLSVGVTAQLNTGAKLLYMLVMFMGRVGPVSLAISLTSKPSDNKRKILPVGQINVG